MGSDLNQIWGEAHNDVVDASAWLPLKSFAFPEHELPLDGHMTYFQQIIHDPWLYRVSGTFGINWPDALQHPMFYVGIYAAIGLSGALVTVFSVTAQYTGALRASRILFKYVLCHKRAQCHFMTFGNRQLLATVVGATFRFHDTTPQGSS